MGRLINAFDTNIVPLAGDPRPILMPFGDSLAGRSSFDLLGTGYTATANAYAGDTTIVVSSTTGLSVGDKIAIRLYTQEVFTTTVASVANSTTLTITDKLPKLLKTTTGFSKYTTARPSTIRQNGGQMAAANAILGNPFKLVQGYGHGGGLCTSMLPDLALWLKRVRPQYVYLHLFENDIAAGVSAADLQRTVRAMVAMCLRAGAIPIVATPHPYTAYTAGAQVAVFDAMKTYVMTTLQALYPKMIPVNVSDPWLDPAAPTLRQPLTSVAPDGVHPQSSMHFYVGKIIADQIAPRIPSRVDPSLFADMAIHANADLQTGTGGTLTGAGSFTGIGAPDGWTITASSGVAVTLSRSAIGNNLRAQMAVAGASDISGTQLQISRTVSLDAIMRGGQIIKPYLIFKINSRTNISMIYPDVTYSGGEQYAGGQETDNITRNEVIGQTIMWEGPAVPIPDGSTTATVRAYFRPLTLGSPSGVALDVEVIGLGLMVDDNAVRGGIVLP